MPEVTPARRRPAIAIGALLLALLPALALGGAAQAAPADTTVPYSGPVIPIPDGHVDGTTPGAVAAAPVTVTAVSGLITKLTLSIDGAVCSTDPGSTTVGLDHSSTSNLVLTLRAPDGTEAVLAQRAGGGGSNFCGTVFDDTATTSFADVAAADQPFSGTFTPAEPLSAFIGMDPNGQWAVLAQDFTVGDTGSIRSFSLHFTTEEPSPGGSISMSGATTSGSTVTYATTLSNPRSTTTNDNPGDEFSSTLPAGLVLVSASAPRGTAIADVGTNMVSWNGTIAPQDSVTVTIVATIAANATSVISTAGTFFFGESGSGVNSDSVLIGPVVFSVTSPAATPGEPATAKILPETGIDVAIPLGVGALLLALGAVTLEVRRRAAR